MNFVKYFFEIYMNFSVFFLQNAEFSLLIAKSAVLLSKKAPFSAKSRITHGGDPAWFGNPISG